MHASALVLVPPSDVGLCFVPQDASSLRAANSRKPMDRRIESFLADVLALQGEDQNSIREAVPGALADCEEILRAQETNKRMKEKAAHACHALCRARVVEEMQRRKGTPTEDHLKLVLSVIDGPQFPSKSE